jgi:hypothetical protein
MALDPGIVQKNDLISPIRSHTHIVPVIGNLILFIPEWIEEKENIGSGFIQRHDAGYQYLVIFQGFGGFHKQSILESFLSETGIYRNNDDPPITPFFLIVLFRNDDQGKNENNITIYYYFFNISYLDRFEQPAWTILDVP